MDCCRMDSRRCTPTYTMGARRWSDFRRSFPSERSPKHNTQRTYRNVVRISLQRNSHFVGMLHFVGANICLLDVLVLGPPLFSFPEEKHTHTATTMESFALLLQLRKHTWQFSLNNPTYTVWPQGIASFDFKNKSQFSYEKEKARQGLVYGPTLSIFQKKKIRSAGAWRLGLSLNKSTVSNEKVSLRLTSEGRVSVQLWRRKSSTTA